MKYFVAAMALICLPANADMIDADQIDNLPYADVVFLGEVHDNPAHHDTQARAIAALAPSALVFEMLTQEQAERVPSTLPAKSELRDLLEWENSGWPDFTMYYPLFAAAPKAHVYGAGLPRAAARAAMTQPPDSIFPGDAARFGLTFPLPKAQQTLREELQAHAHCGALPADLLPGMVFIQRLRDAMLAEAALRAYAQHGGPVIVITGTGHARTDWGAPFLLAQAAPDLQLLSVGQFEIVPQSAPPYDFWIVTDPHPRTDPCEMFR
jgi:uncharacterized iron-regulated protein